MGTSLSGLTPATTFDGLLKTSDNEPLDGTLKAISTGDGTDTILSLSNSALSIGGTLDLNFAGQTNVPMQFYGAGAQVHYISGGNNLNIDYVTTGITENVRLAYNVANRDVSIGQSYSMGAKLGIKGSGATSATTSLLVQNSAGSELLKVTDDGAIDFGVLGLDFSNDGSGGTMSVASDRYIKLASSLSTYSALSAHLFKTFDGSAYSEAMRITGNTDQFVGIGETTPTARLHVKGSGNTNTTTSLLVQNSDATDLLKVSDDGVSNVWLPSSGLKMQRSSACRLEVRGVGAATNIDISPWSGSMSIGGANVNKVSVGSTTPLDSKFSIKGSGATSATTALLVENSAGTDLLKVADDGVVALSNIRAAGNLTLGSSGANRYLVTNGQIHPIGNQDLGRNNLTIYHWNNIYSTGVTHITDNTTSSTTLDASAKLQVDSTTQGFLPPRMTDAERDAITSPAAGLMVYNTSNNQMNYWNGSSWIAF